MKRIKGPVLLATAYIFIFAVLIGMNMAHAAMWMFTFSPVVVIWLVYVVLVHGEKSHRNFSDGNWYDDDQVYTPLD